MTNFASNIDHVAKLDNSLAMSLSLSENNVVLKAGSTYDVSTTISIYNKAKSTTEYKTITGILNTTNIDAYLTSIKTQLELVYPVTVSHSTSTNINSIATFNTINVGLIVNNSGYYIRSMEMNISLFGVQQYSIDATLIAPLEITPKIFDLTADQFVLIDAVVDDLVNIDIVSNNISNVNTVSLNTQNINTVARIQNIANITTVANDLNGMDLNGIADVTIVANDLVKETDSSINIVSGSINSVNTISPFIANVNTVAASISNVNATGSNIVNVNTVAANTIPINIVSANDTGIKYVAANSSTIDSVRTQIVPNIDEILLAPENAAIATTQAGIATTQASAASASAASALGSLNTLHAEYTATQILLDLKAPLVSPALVTPDIGVASGVSFNGITGLSSTAPNMDGTATIGTSTTVALADHIHPSDTSKSDLTTTVIKDSSTGAAYMPSGTTAQRPVSPINGYMRYNSDLLAMEAYINGAWGSVGGEATGGGTDHVFNFLNDYIVTTDYTIPTGKAAVTVGDGNGNVTINSGVTVTVSSGSRWVVL